MLFQTKYASYENCYLVVNRYIADNTLSVMVMSDEEGPAAHLTVCLNCRTLLDQWGYGDTCAFVDVNNLPEAMDFIAEYELGKVTGASATSGYCRYPLVEFDMEKLLAFAG